MCPRHRLGTCAISVADHVLSLRELSGKARSNSLALATSAPSSRDNLGGAPRKKGRGVTLLRDTTQLAVMTHSYHAPLVILSVIVAIFASFAALELAGRVRSESGAPRLGWLAGGGAVMGLGIWSMHFVGMLAFHLPVPIGYDLSLMLVSVVVAIAASFLALIVISRPELGASTLVPAGTLMGGAIAGMHYIGMAPMRMGARQSYSVPIR